MTIQLIRDCLGPLVTLIIEFNQFYVASKS